MKELLSLVRSLFKTAATMVSALFLCVGLLGVIYYPYDTDDPNEPPPPLEMAESEEFYEEVYTGVEEQEKEETADHVYVSMGRDAGEALGVTDIVGRFLDKYDLRGASVLEVGAGSGQLQDVVEDYTGLDIAASAARYFHKPFVHGSATDLPFEDNQFDVIWTVWTLEHVPNPERALQERRRVVKPGGYLLLIPAWNNNSWAADGYEVRPYSDFGLQGKLIKASLVFRDHPLYQYATLVSARMLRRGLWSIQGGGPTDFRYRRVEPNYDRYWVEDSDAINSLDPHEMMLWYTSRGDECVNCPQETGEQIKIGNQPLAIRVLKGAPQSVAGLSDQ